MAHAHAGHSHDHEHEHLHVHSRHADQHALTLAFGITAAFTIIEALGAWISGSLALWADAGHMLSDSVALGLSLFALRLARSRAQRLRTYGLHRAEILAALANGMALVIICGLILYEAWQRLNVPANVNGSVMTLVAVLGL